MRITFYESTRYLLRCRLPQKPDFFQLSQWPHFKNIWLLIINLNKNSIYKQHRIPLIMYATCQDCQGKKVSTNTWMFWCVWRQHGVLKRVDVRDDLVICPAYFFLWVVIPMCRGDVDVLFVKVLNTLYLYNRSGVYASFPQRPVSLWRFSKLEKETVFIEGLFWFLKFYLESKKYKIFRVWVCMKVQIRITFNSQNRSVFSSARGNEREAGHVCTCLTLTDCSVSAGVLDYLLLFSHSAGSCSAAHGGKRAREKSQYDH